MEVAGKCVIGNLRPNNEDAIYISEDGRKKIYIVADGMGGHNGGEVASRAAIDSFLAYVDTTCPERLPEEDLGDILVEGVHRANKAVYEKGLKEENLKNMGTTFTALALSDSRGVIAQVGDSRVYLLRKKQLTQLTRDHSYVMDLVRQGKITMEEALVHPKRNVITRAIGTEDTVEVDIICEPLEDGDYLMLCSDGLYSMLDDEAIKKIMLKKKTLTEIVDNLVDAANKNGGRDNISVIIVRYEVET